MGEGILGQIWTVKKIGVVHRGWHNKVFDRAKQLKQAASELNADNIHYIVNKNLDSYIDNVQTNYAAVKQAGKDFTEGYTFNYEKTGLKPILDDSIAIYES